MKLFERLRSAMKPREQSPGNDHWPSIVFLLHEPHLPNAEEAVRLAQTAWGAVGPVELVGTVGPHSFAIRIDPLYFAIHAAHTRYEVELPQASEPVNQCWLQHTAWLSIDLPGKRTVELRAQQRLGSAYQTIMYFAFKYWSPNCLALYFPAEGTTVPNHGDLLQSIRWCKANGMNLDFLRENKTS